MSEDTKQGQNETEEITVETMPISEQPAEDELPVDASDRSKEQFEKLKAHNKALAEENAALKELQPSQQPQYNSVLDELHPTIQTPSNLPTAQVANIANGLVDKDGYIDPDQLNRTLQEASERARIAEENARKAQERIEKFEENQTVKVVHDAFPQLDPYHAEFDSRFYDMVKNEMIGQLMQGKQDYMAAAKKVNTLLGQSQAKEQAKVAQVEEKQKIISQREQASATTSTAKGSRDPGEYERLIEGTRKGDNLSVGQRLIANGY